MPGSASPSGEEIRLATRKTPGIVLAAGAIALGVVVAAGGCGGEREAPEPAADRQVGQAAPPQRATPEPAEGGVLPQLGDALFDEKLDPTIRAWVALQVGQISGDEATELLVRATGVSDAEVVRAAVESLADRSGPGVREALEAAATHPDPSVARRAREILEGAPPEGA